MNPFEVSMVIINPVSPEECGVLCFIPIHIIKVTAHLG
jgi:hypothetical protein